MPFIETALLGGDSDDGISHFAAVRYRVSGAGTLVTTIYGLDKVISKSLANLTMTTPAGRELTCLTNFKSERALLRIETTEIDEIMKFNRIIIFAKKLYTSYPS